MSDSNPMIGILMPLLCQLDSPLSPEQQSVRQLLIAQASELSHSCCLQSAIRIAGVLDHIVVMKSKQRPKQIVLLGSDGKEHMWLVKQELCGDLRKDTRLMEVAGYMNKWLAMSEKCGRRHLHVRGIVYGSSCLVSLRLGVSQLSQSMKELGLLNGCLTC